MMRGEEDQSKFRAKVMGQARARIAHERAIIARRDRFAGKVGDALRQLEGYRTISGGVLSSVLREEGEDLRILVTDYDSATSNPGLVSGLGGFRVDCGLVKAIFFLAGAQQKSVFYRADSDIAVAVRDILEEMAVALGKVLDPETPRIDSEE